MEHRGGGLSSRERAANEADKILATLGAEDSVNILTAGQAPQTCFFEMSRNHAEAKHFLSAIKPAFTRADFSQANAVTARLLAQNSNRPEIYYLSDFQRRNWANVDFTALPPSARLFFVDCAPPHPDNRAILGATLSQSQVLAGDTVTRSGDAGAREGAAGWTDELRERSVRSALEHRQGDATRSARRPGPASMRN
jgi:hypothetical protein